MAVVYFTSNASTGAGSLAEAIQNAQPGDVIRPDETVFERGSTIEIALASSITLDKNLTVDATPFRVRLDGGKRLRCVLVSPNVTVEFQGFEFVAGKRGDEAGGGALVSKGAKATFCRCVFAGCQGTSGGGLYCSSETEVLLNDSVAFGCCATSGSGGGVASAGRLKISGATIFGNAANSLGADLRSSGETVAVVNSLIGASSANFDAAPGSVVDVASSSVGFVASPPDDLTPETWSADAWQNWDLRLLDDASPTPSPYRDSGDVDAASKYDLEGNFRGRESKGVTTCSPGAYETLQADLFWIGEPFPQEMVDAAPQNIRVANYRQTTGSTLFEADMTWEIPDGVNYSSITGEYSVNNGVTWSKLYNIAKDATQRRANSITPGSKNIVRLRGVFADGSYTAWSVITYVAPLELDGSDGEQSWELRLPSTLSVVNPSFQTSAGWAASRFATSFGDVASQVGQKLFIGVSADFSDAAPENATIVVGATSVVVPALNGAVIVGASRGVAFGGAALELKLGAFAQLTTRGTTTLPYVEFADVGTTVDGVSATVYEGIFFAAAAAPANVTFSENGGWADIRANVTAIDVDPTSATTVAIKITKSDATVAAFAQYSTDDGATWQTVETTADVDEYELTVAQGADVTVRVATATGWLAETVSTAPLLPVWTVSNASESVTGVVNAFEVATGGSNDGLNVYDFNDYGYL